MKTGVKILIALIALFSAMAAAALIPDRIVRAKAEPFILDPEEAGEGYDCILVLGCGAKNGKPSDMLTDRLLRGIELYEKGAAPKLLMSGDHGSANYDEVNVMKDFAVERGVPDHDVFMDHAGFSTYESMYRAKKIFQAEKVLIVTQPYHLYRAVYDARAMGLDAFGTCSVPRTYIGQAYRDLREIAARDKDLLWCIFKPEPTYLGDAIPISGDGNITNDK